MPELPEVEAYRTYLEDTSLRQKIVQVTSQDTKLINHISFAEFKKALIDHTFTKAERWGKYAILTVSGSHKKLVMHFGMNGSVTYAEEGEKPARYAKVTFTFANGCVLYWIDIRKFGGVWLVDDLANMSNLSKLGPDVTKLTYKEFKELALASPRRNIKAFLLSQEKFAGIGNEYADEILFQARINPYSIMEQLSAPQLKKIYTVMQGIIKYAIKVRVAQIRCKKEKDTSMCDAAHFADTYLQAHRHKDKVCPKNNKHKLKKATIAGRTTYYCPVDQKEE